MKKFIQFCFVFYFLCETSLWGLPAQVMMIRHAEKPHVGNQLNLRGEERAAALVPFFLKDPRVLQFGYPAAIFAQRVDRSDQSVRPIQTVTPLADHLNQRINTQFAHKEYLQMVEKIKNDPSYDGKVVLISWEHHVIPDIAYALGVRPRPANWPDDVFDRVWLITYQSDGSVNFEDIPQRLMFGDSTN